MYHQVMDFIKDQLICIIQQGVIYSRSYEKPGDFLMFLARFARVFVLKPTSLFALQYESIQSKILKLVLVRCKI